MAALVTAHAADEQSEAAVRWLHVVKSSTIAKMVLRTYGARVFRKHWSKTRAGFLRLARRYGLKKLAMYLKWSKASAKFFYRRGVPGAKRLWRSLKRMGFHRWWAVYGRLAKRYSGFGRNWWLPCIGASRWAWPKH